MDEEKEYSGIWKKVGCILSVIAIFSMLGLFFLLVYLFFSGF